MIDNFYVKLILKYKNLIIIYFYYFMECKNINYYFPFIKLVNFFAISVSPNSLSEFIK